MVDPSDSNPSDHNPKAQSSAKAVPTARPVPWAPDAPPVAHEHDILLMSSTRGSVWVDIVQVVGFLILFEFLLGSILFTLLGPEVQPPENGGVAADAKFNRALLLPLLGMRAAASLAVVGMVVRFRGQSLRSLGLEWPNFKLNCLLGGLSTLVVYVLILFLRPILWLIWPDEPELMRENAERIMSLVPRLHPLGFAGVALVIGFYEETLFRGFLMTRLRRATGSWTVALIASTLAFAALHLADQTAPAVVWVTILSVVFSVVTIWRRSIIPAIVGHALFDLSQFLTLHLWAGDSWT